MTSDWSECSVSCGRPAIQRREIFCTGIDLQVLAAYTSGDLAGYGIDAVASSCAKDDECFDEANPCSSCCTTGLSVFHFYFLLATPRRAPRDRRSGGWHRKKGLGRDASTRCVRIGRGSSALARRRAP